MRQGVKRLLSMALALVAIVGSFVIFFNGIQPEYQNLYREQAELASLERVAEDRRAAVEKIEEIIGEYSGDNAASLRSRISLALPLGVDMASALVQLVGLMRLSDVTLEAIKPKIETAPAADLRQVVQSVGTISYDINAQGTYSNVKEFLRRLESNIMIFEVRKVGISPVRQGSDVVKVSLTVVSFYQPI